MPNTPNDMPPQTNGASSTIARWGLRTSHLGILIQGLAVYLAFSILLGRVYFLKYFDTLGIPISDVDIHITDYSIISPDVTILGVGLALVWPLLLFVQRASIQPRQKWLYLVIGAILTCVSLGLAYLPDLFGIESKVNFGYSGLTKLFTLALSMIGGAFIASGLLHSGAIEMPTDPSERARVTSTARQLFPLILLVVAIYVVLTASRYSNEIAELDAEKSLADSPAAMVELVSSNSNLSNQETWLYSESGTAFGYFAIVFIGKKFVYLRPSESKSEVLAPHLYVVPAEDIKSVTYIQPPTS